VQNQSSNNPIDQPNLLTIQLRAYSLPMTKRNPPTLYHVPKTISSPIVQILYELNAVSSTSGVSASSNSNSNSDVVSSDNTNNGSVNIDTLTFADLKSSKHLKRNPMGTSPTFTDEKNNISIWESGAVLTYILEMYDTNYTLHPAPPQSSLSSTSSSLLTSTSTTTSSSLSTPHQRAKFLHLQQYIVATVYPFLSSLYLHTLKPKKEQDENYIINSKDKWMTLLAPTLSRFLGDNENENDNDNNVNNDVNDSNDDFIYFMGRNNISAIDYLICKPLGNAYSLGILDNDKQFPKLYDIYKKIKCMSSYNLAYNDNDTKKKKKKKKDDDYNDDSNNNNNNTTPPCGGEFRSMILIPGK
jgi:glutathione S-transferase